MVSGAAATHQSRSVSSDHPRSEASLSEAISWLLDRIDFRRADTAEERDAISRLRYEAYLREGAIAINSTGMFSDPYDETDNVYLFGLYIDGQLASSIRMHVATSEHSDFPSLHVFPEILQPYLDAGKVVVDTTRFVADETLSRRYRGLAYATLRLGWLTAAYFNSDYCLAAVRTEHQAFYRRAFSHRLIGEPRPYPHLEKPICLMAIHYPSVADDVHRRYPFFRSTLFERRMLFERSAAPTSHESPKLSGNIAPYVEHEH